MSASKLQLVGGLIREMRQKKGLTQSQVAKIAGTKTGYYAKIEQGEKIPSLPMLEKIAKALDTKSSNILPF
jgi:transcriptional regulator with XRE-family HTH domain